MTKPNQPSVVISATRAVEDDEQRTARAVEDNEQKMATVEDDEQRSVAAPGRAELQIGEQRFNWRLQSASSALDRNRLLCDRKRKRER